MERPLSLQPTRWLVVALHASRQCRAETAARLQLQSGGTPALSSWCCLTHMWKDSSKPPVLSLWRECSQTRGPPGLWAEVRVSARSLCRRGESRQRPATLQPQLCLQLSWAQREDSHPSPSHAQTKDKRARDGIATLTKGTDLQFAGKELCSVLSV